MVVDGSSSSPSASSCSSSSSSAAAESSFRELDDVFLQSQARIWLGEVLRMRFEEQLNICDLLSDGELLFEVSKVLWNMLLVKYMELRHVKAHMFIPVDTRRSSGRYRPYSNVDSFLKVCKVLGLNGVDLFSPSDVVEKRDTRKVCICIRSLSKKARAKQLNVPDFDIVTKTVAMPTDVVGSIRRSLELSTCSVTHSQGKDTRLKFRQRSSYAARKQKDDSSFEEIDEAKSYPSAIQSYSSDADTSYMDALYFEESPDALNKYTTTEDILQLFTPHQETDKFSCLPGSPESILLPYVSNGGPVKSISPTVNEPQTVLHDEFTHVTYGAQFWHDDRELAQIGMGANSLSLQNVLAESTAEVIHTLHQFALSDTISFRILTNGPFHISEDCLRHSCMDSETHDSNSTPNTSMYGIWRQFPDVLEASPTKSMSPVVGRVLDFDFDAESDPADLRTSVSSTPDLQKYEAERLDKASVMNRESLDMEKYIEPLESTVLGAEESLFGAEIRNFDPSAESFSLCSDDSVSYSVDQDFQKSPNQIDSEHSLPFVNKIMDVTGDAQELEARKGDSGPKSKLDLELDCCSSNVFDRTKKESEGICNDRLAVALSEKCHNSIQNQTMILQEVGRKGFGEVDKGSDRICTAQSEDVHSDAVHTNKVTIKDERKEHTMDCLAEESLDGRNDKGTGNLQKKPNHIGPLLKTVAKGTALVGILFLLHLRSGRDKIGDRTEQSNPIHESTGVRFSTRKGEKGSRIYPAEKFKFGD